MRRYIIIWKYTNSLYRPEQGIASLFETEERELDRVIQAWLAHSDRERSREIDICAIAHTNLSRPAAGYYMVPVTNNRTHEDAYEHGVQIVTEEV